MAKIATSLLLMTRVLAALTESSESVVVPVYWGLLRTFDGLQLAWILFYFGHWCQLQARIGASRLEYKLKKKCLDKTKLRVIEKVACARWMVCGKDPQTLLVKNLDAICPAYLRPAANLYGGKRADTCKMLLQPTAVCLITFFST